MPRFSLSPTPSYDDDDDDDERSIYDMDVNQQQQNNNYGINEQQPQQDKMERRRLRLDDDDFYGDDSESDDDEEKEEYDYESEEEEPHPLGFPDPSYGKTRFCLIDDDEDELEWWARGGAIVPFLSQAQQLPRQQYYPPVHSSHTYLPSYTVRTPVLLHYHNRAVMLQQQQEEEERKMEEELIQGMDRIARLVKAACYLDDEDVKRCCDVDSSSSSITPLQQQQQQQQNPLWKLAAAAERHEMEVKQKMDMERRKMEQDRMRASDTLRKLIARDEAAARVILTRERKEKEARDAAEKERIAEQKKQDDLQRQKEEAIQKQKEEKLRKENERIAAQKAQEEERIRKIEEEERKKTEYVVKAKKLCDQLVTLRSTLEPFEKLKAASRRRLNMKKVVRGKLNTLSHDAAKICNVAQEISTAINEARNEDAALKQQIQAGAEGMTSEMARGKRYLVDLLASNVIVRVQAESFNGTRGDGFPLAAMLAKLSLDAKELVPTFTAHIYTACPIAIPTLPGGDSVSGGSEEDLMESLGMQKDKNGEYETFDRFLGRTEGLISLVAEIMSSTPENHSLLGGHKGAVIYLERFLALLPPAPAPLPLFTAPVLVAFLTGAGHMLANKFPDKFKPLLDTITKDVMLRLDEGTIGVPSATRLRKATEDGFDGFKKKLPPGAIPELYDGGKGSGSGVPAPAAAAAAPSSASGSMAGPSLGGQPMSAGEGSNSSPAQNASTNPFGAPPVAQQQHQQSSQNNSFGGAQQGIGTTSTPFGQTQNDNMTDTTKTTSSMGASPFRGQPQQTTPFGGTTNTPSQGLGSSNPFGGNAAATNPSPFGGGPNAVPFGTTPGGGAGSTFGQTSNPTVGTSNPFGGGATNTQPGPFGGGSTGNRKQDNRPPCKFFAEGKCRNGANCNFSHEQSNAQPNNAFNAGNNNQDGRPPCKFFAEGKCRNGANCKFSHATPGDGSGGNAQPGAFGNTPFGGGGITQTTPFGGGGNTQTTPFGGGGTSAQSNPFGGGGTGVQSTPFGGGGTNVQTTPFGGNATQKSPFGGGNATQGFGNSGAGVGGEGFGAFGGGTNTIANPFGAPQR